jgi:histidinol phosphatase-like PHP family hydrolase
MGGCTGNVTHPSCPSRGRVGLRSPVMPLANTDVAELLARAGADADGHRARAYLAAARTALLWEEEAADLVAQERPLTELERIGPSLARRVREWIERDEPVPEPPAVRRDFSGFAAARRTLAGAPERARVRGDLQMHTVYSDGAETVADMALEGAARGYDYVAITDHSKGLRVAGGIDEATLAVQAEEIAQVNRALSDKGIPLVVLHGLEMNIDLAGEGDMDPAALAGLDLVLGSFHSALRRAEDQTDRYLAALRNPLVDVIGHPRGRKFNNRLGLVADWGAVLEEAAALGKAVETDAFPDRQDLNRDILRIAADLDVWVSIGTDAHDTNEMRFVDVGIAAALEAGVPRGRILNHLSPDELARWRAERASVG